MEHYVAFLFLAFLYGIGYYVIQMGRKGKGLKIRHLAALDAIKETIGRATEMGRPICFTTGHGGGGMYTMQAGSHLAGLSILGFVAEECAELGTNLIFVPAFSEMVPMGENVIREAYIAAGKPEAYRPDMVRYYSNNPLAYNLGVISVIRQEKVAANIMIGAFYSSDALIIGAAGALEGALQIGGSTGMGTVANFITVCDYVLMGDETPAAGAYISGDIPLLNTIICGDYMKYVVMALVILGSVLVSIGVDLSWYSL